MEHLSELGSYHRFAMDPSRSNHLLHFRASGGDSAQASRLSGNEKGDSAKDFALSPDYSCETMVLALTYHSGELDGR